MVMEAGKIIETKEADELFAKPEHPYTKKLLAAIPKQETRPLQNSFFDPTLR